MSLKQIFKRAVAALLLSVITVSLGSAVPTEAAAKPPFDVSLTFGNNGFLESGINVPFNVTLSNNSDDFEGSVWLILPMSRKDVAAYERKISLAAGSSKTVTFICYTATISNKCSVRVTDSKGKNVLEKEFQLNYDSMNQYARVGILSDDYNALSSISGYRLAGLQDITILTEKFTEKTFPEDTRALDFMDVLIISDFSSDRLSDAQRSALIEWVSKGGLLIVGTGTGASKVLKGFPELSFIELDDLKTVSTDFGTSDSSRLPVDVSSIFANRSYEDSQAIAVYSSIDEDFFKSEEYLALNSLDERREYIFDQNKDAFINYVWYDYNGESYAQSQRRMSPTELSYQETYFRDYCVMNLSDRIIEFSKAFNFVPADENIQYYKTQITEPLSGVTLIRGFIENASEPYSFANMITYGNGNVCTLATDISKQPFITSDTYFRTVSYLIEFFKGPALYQAYISGGYGNYGDDMYRREQLAYDLTIGNLLPVPAYLLIFIAYTALGFIAFFFLKKRKRSVLLWPVQIGLAVTATVLIFVCSLVTRITKPSVNSIKFSEVSDKVVNETAVSGVILPKNRSYDINFSKDYFPQLIRSDSYYYGYNTNFDKLVYNVAWLDTQGSNSISLRGKAALAKEALMFSRSKETSGYEISFNASYSDYKLSGYVQNNTEKTLEDCVIMADYMIYRLGTLTPGSKVDLSRIIPVSVFNEEKRYNYVSADNYHTARLLSGLPESEISPSYLIGFKNNEFRKDYLRFTACRYLIENNGFATSGIIRDSSYAEGGLTPYSSKFSYGYSSYHTYPSLEEVYRICDLNSDGCPKELITQPYFIGFDFETAESMLSNTKNASESLLEVIMVPGNMTEDH
jgi:hypothetical protein